MKLSELKSIIMECIEEITMDESGPADRFRKKHGKIQDTGEDPLAYKSGLKDSSGKLKSRNYRPRSWELDTKITAPDSTHKHNIDDYFKTHGNKDNRSNPVVYKNPSVFIGNRAKRGNFKKFDRSAKHHKANWAHKVKHKWEHI